MRTIITIHFILLFSTISFSQEKTALLKSTYGYGTLGTFGFVFAASANVEYHLLNTRYVKLGPKLSLGAFASGDFDGGGTTSAFLRPSLCVLIGVDRIAKLKPSYFFEVNYGYIPNDDKKLNIRDPIYLFAGLRKVSTNNTFWRLGFGIPEVIQFSFGYNF